MDINLQDALTWNSRQPACKFAEKATEIETAALSSEISFLDLDSMLRWNASDSLRSKKKDKRTSPPPDVMSTIFEFCLPGFAKFNFRPTPT